MASVFILATALCAATLGSPASPSAPPAQPWHLLQHLGEGGLDAALSTRDLRRLDGDMQRFAGLLGEVEAGRALLGQKASSPPGEAAVSPLQALFHCVAPQGQAIPAVLALFTEQDSVTARLALQVRPGVLQRCAGQTLGGFRLVPRSAPEPKAQPGVTVLDLLQGPGEPAYVGVLLQDKILVVGSTLAPLLQGNAAPAAVPTAQVSAGMQAALQGTDSVLWLRGGGQMVARLAAPCSGALRAGLMQATALALALQTDGGSTATLRLLAEAPWAQALATALGGPQNKDVPPAWTPHVSADALGFATLRSSPLLRAAIPAALAQLMGRATVEVPDDVLRLFSHLSGSLAWVAYAAPGDWALALQLDDEARADDLLPVLQAFATATAQRLTPGASSTFELETCPHVARPVLHLRPDPALPGPYVAALGNTVWLVQERSRLLQLAEQSAAPAKGQGRKLLAGPLSPMMRDALASKHMAQAYSVLSGDGRWLDAAAWGAGLVQAELRAAAVAQSAPLLGAMAPALPRLLGALYYLWMQTYDAALSVDVSDGLLDVAVVASGM